MLPGRPLAARFVRRDEAQEFCENERLKRPSGLCAAQHVGYVRSNKRSVARTSSASRTRTCRSCNVEHVESDAQRKSVRRLEPERRTQNNDLRLLASRQTRTNRFYSGHLGRSRQLFEKEESRPPEISLR